ncbi:MAG: SPOR domain-containing protein [Pseudomonadales bacterium]|nr:SPOR domain-containing protein [Pseudomonadales bacterium]
MMDNSVDDETRRYRITGSIFLLAVAIIVLPMIFDGDGLPESDIEPMPELSLPALAPPIPEPLPDNPYLEEIETLSALVDENGFTREDKTLVGEPVLTKPDAGTRNFAVQVGSFSSESRALGLRDALRGEGYDAFLSTLRKGDKVWIRVAVGPFQARSDAEAVRRRLAGKYADDARLMAFRL